MNKVTVKHQSGVYWAVCGNVSYIKGSGYLLDSIMEDSLSIGPHPWAKVPEDWKIIFVEEV